MLYCHGKVISKHNEETRQYPVAWAHSSRSAWQVKPFNAYIKNAIKMNAMTA